MKDLTSSFVQKLIFESDEFFSSLSSGKVESMGIDKNRLVKKLKRSLKELNKGNAHLYSRTGYSFYKGNLEQVLEIRFTDIVYDMETVCEIPLGKRIIGDEHLYFIGIKGDKNNILEIFKPKHVFREEDISKLEKLN